MIDADLIFWSSATLDIKQSLFLQGQVARRPKQSDRGWICGSSAAGPPPRPIWITVAQAETVRPRLVSHFARLAEQLGDQPFLLGDQMTIADPYLFWALKWAAAFEIDRPERLHAYYARLKDRPSVAKALAEEGID